MNIAGRLSFLDALRGWAILGVFITHCGSLVKYNGFFSPLVLQVGYGVQLFFMISAFTIFYTLDHAKNNEKSIYVNFYIKRLFRIAPIYWFGIVLYTLFFGLQSRGWLPGPELWHYPYHLVFMNLIHPATPSSVVPGGWSISCEVLFYLLCPILFIFVNSVKRAFVFSLAAVFFGVLYFHIAKSLFHHELVSLYGEKLSGQFLHRNILSQLGCFSFGILLFHLYKENKIFKFFSGKRNNLFLIVVALFVGMIALSGVMRSTSHYVATLTFFIVGVAIISRPNVFVLNRMTTFIGRISYSTYIYHFLVIYFFNYALGVHAGFYSVLFLSFLITVPLSYLSFIYIESRCSRLAKQIVTRREQRFNFQDCKTQ